MEFTIVNKNLGANATALACGYRDAGNALVEGIKSVVKQPKRQEVMGGLGGFCALCALPQKYREPILVSGTGNIGAKCVWPWI